MANIIDFSDALAQEGTLAKRYDALAQQASSDQNKAVLQELVDLSEKKMKLLHKLLVDMKWF